MNSLLWQLVFKKPLPLFLIALSSILGAISVLAWCYFLAVIIDGVFLCHLAIGELEYEFFGLAIALIVRLITTLVSEESALRLSSSVRSEVSAEILKKMQQIGPLALKSQDNANSLLNLLSEGVELLDGFLRLYFPLLIKAVVFPIVFLVYILPNDPTSGIIMLVTAPLVIVFMILIGRFSAIASKRSWKVLEQISGYLQDVIYGLTTLKMLGQSEKQGEKIAQISEKFRKTNLNVLKIAFLSAFTLELVTTISIAMVAVGLGIRLIEGEVNFALALMLIFLAPEYYLPLRNLGSQFHANLNAGEAAQSIAQFLQTSDSPLFSEGKNTSVIFNDEGLFFNQVSYHYANTQGVDNISFSLPKDKMTVLIGPSGGGKTTVLNLAAGFLNPQEGNITYGGADLTEVSSAAWQRNIAYIPQQPHIFSATLLDNLKLYAPSKRQTEVQEIIERLELNAFLADFPQGYDTLLGENGQDLSGGQKQLIAIVRAALKDAPLIICDEFSQGLDLLSEEKILNSLKKLAQKQTMLVAAHRKNCVEYADYAIKIAQGEISYQGWVKDLINTNQDFWQYIGGRDEKAL